MPSIDAFLASVPFLFPQCLPCLLLPSSPLLNATTTFSFILYCTPSKCPFPWQKSIPFMLTEAQWHLESRGNTTAHQAMLKGGQGFSSGKRRLTNQGARLLTCKCKKTGDGCHKDQGDEGCILKGHRTWGQHGRHTLATDIFKWIFGYIINPTTGCACAGARVIAQHIL